VSSSNGPVGQPHSGPFSETISVATDDILGIEKSAQSIMPEGLFEALGRTQSSRSCRLPRRREFPFRALKRAGVLPNDVHWPLPPSDSLLPGGLSSLTFASEVTARRLADLELLRTRLLPVLPVRPGGRINALDLAPGRTG
jgi:hypothetical protein